MTASRCRWHFDEGRCPDDVAFPDAQEAPPFCLRHLGQLEAWVRTRAARPSDAPAWIAWAARRAQNAEHDLRALGILRPPRALDDGRPVIPRAPERR